MDDGATSKFDVLLDGTHAALRELTDYVDKLADEHRTELAVFTPHVRPMFHAAAPCDHERPISTASRMARPGAKDLNLLVEGDGRPCLPKSALRPVAPAISIGFEDDDASITISAVPEDSPVVVPSDESPRRRSPRSQDLPFRRQGDDSPLRSPKSFQVYQDGTGFVPAISMERQQCLSLEQQQAFREAPKRLSEESKNNIESTIDNDRFGKRASRDSRLSELSVEEVWPDWKEQFVKEHGKAKRANTTSVNFGSAALMPTLREYRKKRLIRTDSYWVHRISMWTNSMDKQWRKDRQSIQETFPGGWRFDYWCAPLVLSPISTARLVWDVLGILAISYDIITIPLEAFYEASIGLIARLTLAYWVMDILLSLFRGYYANGQLEKRVTKIAWRYLTGWCAFDVLVCCADWALMLWENSEEGDSAVGNIVGYARAGKSARFLRIMRLARLLKVRGMVSKLYGQIQSETFQILTGIFGLICMIILANHIIACVFWLLGTSELGFEDTWVEENNMLEERQWKILYQYTTSLHWSLTQFTPASMEIFPKNGLERAYTVCTLLLAMVTFSSFVSSLTGAMTQLRNLNSDRYEQQVMLDRYLKDNNVTLDVYLRVTGLASLFVSRDCKTRRIHMKDLIILSALPSQIQVELRNEIFGPILRRHPFFYQMSLAAPAAVRKVYDCIAEITLVGGLELFASWDPCDNMYFLINGMVKYLYANVDLDGGSIREFSAQIENVLVDNEGIILKQGSWFCESALWLRCRHSGTAVAKTTSELVQISATKFRAMLSRDRKLWQVSRYAALFAKGARSDEHNCRVGRDICEAFDVLQERAQVAWTEPSLRRGSGGSLESVSCGSLEDQLAVNSSARRNSVGTATSNDMTTVDPHASEASDSLVLEAVSEGLAKKKKTVSFSQLRSSEDIGSHGL